MALHGHRDANSIPQNTRGWIAGFPEGLTDADTGMSSVPSFRRHRRVRGHQEQAPGILRPLSWFLSSSHLWQDFWSRSEHKGSRRTPRLDSEPHRDQVTAKSSQTWEARFADDFNMISRPIIITEPGRLFLASSSLGQQLDKCRSKQDPQRFLSLGISLSA